MTSFSLGNDGYCQIRHKNGEAFHFENLTSEVSKMSFVRHFEDLSIRCQDKTNFCVNKLVLIESSKLLKKIFSAPEFALNFFTPDLICPDFDSDALKHVINLVYFGKTSISIYNEDLRQNMIDILRVLQIDIFLAAKSKPKTKALEEPMEITLDDDSESVTMEYERPALPRHDNPASPAKDGDVLPKTRDRKQHKPKPKVATISTFEPQGFQRRSRQDDSARKSFDAKICPAPEQTKDQLEVLNTPEPLTAITELIPKHDFEQLAAPEHQSTPKSLLFRCQYCQNGILSKIGLENHERKCKKTLVENSSLINVHPSLSNKQNDQMMKCDWCKKNCSSQEDKEMHECIENSPVIKAESSIDFQESFNSSSASLLTDVTATSTRPLNDIHFSILTVSQENGLNLNRTFPFNKTKNKVIKQSGISSTPPSASQPGRPSQGVNIAASEGVKDPILMKVPVSELISESNPSDTSAIKGEMLTKTETSSDGAHNPPKLDCPKCKIEQANPRSLMSHVESFHFKRSKNLKSEILWKCFNCSRVLTRKSELLSHAISCPNDVATKPKPTFQTILSKKLTGSACNTCGGRKGASFYKRKQKCGVCQLCLSPKCNECKFCQKPSLRKPCIRRVCRQMVNPRCVCPSSPNQN